jgi:hypothetical protein
VEGSCEQGNQVFGNSQAAEQLVAS